MTGDHGGLELWRSFPQDPREPANAPLRAADADRDRVRDVLAAAYAEGRLTRDEFDERSDAVAAARTLGDLPALVEDLVPAVPARAPASSYSEQALAWYRKERVEALWAFVMPSVICWVIWIATSIDKFYFPWPAIVTAATGLNFLRVLVTREALVEDRERKLRRKAEKRELESRPTDEDDA